MIRSLVALVLLSPVTVQANNCDNFYKLALKAGELRQQGLMIDHKPRTFLEDRMMVNLFQFPGYRKDEERRKAATRFANYWNEACRAGWYN